MKRIEKLAVVLVSLAFVGAGELDQDVPVAKPQREEIPAMVEIKDDSGKIRVYQTNLMKAPVKSKEDAEALAKKVEAAIKNKDAGTKLAFEIDEDALEVGKSVKIADRSVKELNSDTSTEAWYSYYYGSRHSSFYWYGYRRHAGHYVPWGCGYYPTYNNYAYGAYNYNFYWYSNPYTGYWNYQWNTNYYYGYPYSNYYGW